MIGEKEMIRLVWMLLFVINSIYADLLILNYSTPEKINPKALKDIKALQTLAQEHGIKVTTKGMPWKRALKMVELGRADGVINASYKKDRARYAYYPMQDDKPDFSKRLNDGNTYYIYKNKNSSIVWDGKKFSNVDGPVGAKDTYAVIEDLKKHKNIEVVTKVKEEHLIADLYKGKLSAYSSIPYNIEQILAKMPKLKGEIVKDPLPIRKKPYFVIFSKKVYKKKKEEIEKLWDALKAKND